MPHETLMRHSPAPPPVHDISPNPRLLPNPNTTNSPGKSTPNYRAEAATKNPFTLLAPKLAAVTACVTAKVTFGHGVIQLNHHGLV